MRSRVTPLAARAASTLGNPPFCNSTAVRQPAHSSWAEMTELSRARAMANWDKATTTQKPEGLVILIRCMDGRLAPVDWALEPRWLLTQPGVGYKEETALKTLELVKNAGQPLHIIIAGHHDCAAANHQAKTEGTPENSSPEELEQAALGITHRRVAGTAWRLHHAINTLGLQDLVPRIEGMVINHKTLAASGLIGDHEGMRQATAQHTHSPDALREALSQLKWGFAPIETCTSDAISPFLAQRMQYLQALTKGHEGPFGLHQLSLLAMRHEATKALEQGIYA